MAICDDNTKHASILKSSTIAESWYAQYKQNASVEKHYHDPILNQLQDLYQVAYYVMQQIAVLFSEPELWKTAQSELNINIFMQATKPPQKCKNMVVWHDITT
jgi:hypothetical protein